MRVYKDPSMTGMSSKQNILSFASMNEQSHCPFSRETL